MSALSNTFGAHESAHSEECHFALVEAFALCSTNQGSPRSRFQVRNSVRPIHHFIHTFDHACCFGLPHEEERDAQTIVSLVSVIK
jgi:hypothetical protein